MLVLDRLVILHRSGPCKAFGGVALAPQLEPHIKVVHLEDALRNWREFGQAIGIDEDAHRQNDAEKRRLAAEGLLGCSWLKCPLYRTELGVPGRPSLTCSGCRKVSEYFFEALVCCLSRSHYFNRPNTAVLTVNEGERSYVALVAAPVLSYFVLHRDWKEGDHKGRCRINGDRLCEGT